MLLAARLNRTATEVGGVTEMTRVQPIKTSSINKAHQVLGHMSEEATHLTAKALGWHITMGKMMVCECCAIGKAKQKRVKIDKPKEKRNEANGRIYLDLSRIVSPMSENQPRRPNWCMIVDEKTGYKTSTFHEKKGGMVELVCKQIQKWKNIDKEVKIIRMDGSGENRKLVKRLNCDVWKLYPKIEYTARDTPQHNLLVEVGFATVYGRGRAMMIEANIP